MLGGAAYGWISVVEMMPVVVAVAAAFFFLGGREGDAGAIVRHQPDERQAGQQLRVQAFVGRTMSVTAAGAYLIAVLAGATLWPYAVVLGVMVVSFVVGWAIYGERTSG